jgi:hypothetical protein
VSHRIAAREVGLAKESVERNVKFFWSRQADVNADGTVMPPQPPNDRDDTLPPSLWQLAVKWGSSLTVLALIVSLVVHISGGVIANFITMRGDLGSRGGGSGGAPVEMAIGAAGPLSDLSDVAAGPSLPAVPEDVGGGSVELSMSSAGSGAPGVSDGGEAGGSELGGLGGSLSGGGDISIGGGLGGGGRASLVLRLRATGLHLSWTFPARWRPTIASAGSSKSCVQPLTTWPRLRSS